MPAYQRTLVEYEEYYDNIIIKELEEIELPSEDGIPMESNWHRLQMNFLIECIEYHWQDRNDYFVGGNMFIYYSLKQVRNREYRGPDVFVVKDTDGTKNRDSWIVWQEDGKYPDVIIELSSPSTINIDLKDKKKLYEQTFHTAEYFCYDPTKNKLMGWRLENGRYIEITPNEKGWLWCKELNLWLGKWNGEFLRLNSIWIRFYNPYLEMIPTFAEAEAKRAEAEAVKVKKAEEEIIRLKALLTKHGINEGQV
ncbi:MAG: Uma2 family endonuclease [Desulfobacterales bacterium]|nr:Uma2 family endonuclease [Desulfobacterales bacterium]MBF0396551.1 Uma2 family endonuclease [Desulfobacterales bacterium]